MGATVACTCMTSRAECLVAHTLLTLTPVCVAALVHVLTLQVLAVDVHPAARFGRGILLDHGTGVVIGETAVIGNNVSLLQVGTCDSSGTSGSSARQQ